MNQSGLNTRLRIHSNDTINTPPPHKDIYVIYAQLFYDTNVSHTEFDCVEDKQLIRECIDEMKTRLEGKGKVTFYVHKIRLDDPHSLIMKVPIKKKSVKKLRLEERSSATE